MSSYVNATKQKDALDLESSAPTVDKSKLELSSDANTKNHPLVLGAPFASSEDQAGQPGDLRVGPAPPATVQIQPQVNTMDPERIRKDRHVEVERRRRDNIASRIDELAEIVPDCENKSKGETIQLAVQYIKDHHENEAKRMQERFLAEQKLQQLRQKMEMLEKCLENVSDEGKAWKELGLSLGLTVEEGEPSSHMGSASDQVSEGQE